ncbi:zinc transporter 5 isoform X1 [Cucumis melo var. makuwa]|uniref:Zinc transporter 5 isoform X1 n=1 Tax=Cucumis melo var. makuwa TaxID=1194695 RepID=A0A5A7V5K1_CUCMM|nr:zinc transporter 5 isoform X1 [Cucumis melo var. makuwa]
MMSPRPMTEDRGSSPNFRHTPLQIIHMVGNFFRIWSIYSMYRYFSQTGASVVLFLFCCLAPAAIIFLTLQKPWKGKPLSNTQVVPSVINGAITALYFILWGKGLKACGPLRAVLAEYSGAVLGVLSAVLHGRRGFVWKKVGGLIAMLVSFYFLAQGWAMATHFPFYILWKLPRKDSFDSEGLTEEVLGLKEMVIPIFAGILSALRRVIARRVSLKNQLKRRLHAITMASATCFLFPIAMWDMIIGSTSDNGSELPFSTWAFLSTIIFGVILIFYVDSIAEERLHMIFSSPRHLMVAGGSIILLEIVYKMDFSLVGFVICCSILGFGIYEATSLDRSRKDSSRNQDISNGLLDDQDQMPSLPT